MNTQQQTPHNNDINTGGGGAGGGNFNGANINQMYGSYPDYSSVQMTSLNGQVSNRKYPYLSHLFRSLDTTTIFMT